MSHNNCILLSLNLKDENIIFDQNYITYEDVKGVNSLVYHAKLTYIPHHCEKCGCIYSNRNQFEKHGFKPSLITLPKVSNMNAYLKLRKQRILCHECGSTFTLRTNIVEPNCYISNNTKLAIALEASDIISECDIAKRFNTSHSTVNRIINSYYEIHHPHRHKLPECLCFDEFKSVKSCDGAMSFIYCDAQTGEIIDIVEDRRLKNLITYFQRFSRETRLNVKVIVIDMYKPYISLIKSLFPNAKIVIDRFHIVQLISRALNKTRIRIMNNDHKNYTKFKNYWRLLLKNRNDLDIVNYRYYRCFRGMLCEEDVVNYLLDLNHELKSTYELYQDILNSIKNNDIERFNSIIDNIQIEYPNISSYMKTSIKTIKENYEYIINSLKYKYTNGVLEGINNKIKVIKRVAFGYRSFYHFKVRILIVHKLSKLIKYKKPGLSKTA